MMDAREVLNQTSIESKMDAREVLNLRWMPGKY